MLSKKIWLGIPAIALVLGFLVAACGNDTINAEIQKKKATQVKEVKITKTTDNTAFILTWDAVKDENVSYSVWVKQDGKKNASGVSANVTNTKKYDPADGAEESNSDPDKWSAKVTYVDIAAGGAYCFGVKTTADNGAAYESESDIKWASSYPFTEAKVAAVTLKEEGGYFIAEWDAVENATYSVNGQYKNSGSSSWNSFYGSEQSSDPGKVIWKSNSSYSAGTVAYVQVTLNLAQSNISVISVAVKSNTVTIPAP